MNSLVSSLKKNAVFKFVSSVRLAVPLMISLAIIVAVGTVIEAEYNAQYAGLIIYKSLWFQLLLGLLGLNIFCAALSRWPYKKHHTGFVITHAGLLTLLFGSLLTYLYGIDGQLRIVEKEKSATVVLSELVIKYRLADSSIIRSFSIPRLLSPKESQNIAPEGFQHDTGLSLQKILPFISPMQAMSIGSSPSRDNVPVGGPRVKFNLKSQFFNVDQELGQSEVQMGPVTLRLVKDGDAPKSHAAAPVQSSKDGSRLVVLENGKSISSISLSQLKKSPAHVKNFTIEFVRTYEQAVVGSNQKLEEKGEKGQNPAIEFFVVQGSQKFREVKFTKFPTFGLAKVKIPGISFAYEYSNSAESNDSPPSSASKPNGNVVEFHISKSKPDSAVVELYKAGAQVLKRQVKAGETLQTPWMGMTVTMNEIIVDADKVSTSAPKIDSPAGIALMSAAAVRPASLAKKMPMLPSAVWVRSAAWPAEQGIWIAEGDSKIIHTNKGEVEVYYGPDSIELPFSVELLQFQKIDYPGTSTPKSFQSTVRAGHDPASIEIKMNEPLEKDGYILYQASYEMNPGTPTASIFSVNKDPGRTIKYFGAIILSLGIVIFTLMRSRWYLKRGTQL